MRKRERERKEEAARTKRIHANVSHRIEGRIFNQNEFFRLLFVCRLFPIRGT